ncbi:MAG: hypothetical protein HN580_15715 [Deltaproteobacteria bacterium]|jgi:hypothetical protein|nr:hypothetical protein [Deltaproteobacteria bacterium]MBT4263139.1 hypothetical protein [Deltaproteobacteria bacterium]MBT4637325.1 hypothetical protein [Deltaproteobacteria bacterium]MBT6504369.1 hypothetical protein [Deltaproteobacteria bacterium]MBT6611307.1 hypothetical protein [Deltaproteobacteria bacterium]
MATTFANQHWILIAFIFFGFLGYIVFLRWLDQRWINRKYGSDNVRTISYGVNYYGRTSDEGKIRRSTGVLVLLTDRLFFRSRRARLEIEIPGDKLLNVYHDVRHRGEELHTSLMMVEFINENKRKDTAAFKVPYPPQWIQSVQSTLKG